MPLFNRVRDISLFDHINRELIIDIIDTVITVYKINAYETKEDLYGEALNRVYFPDVTVAGLIEHDAPNIENDEFGTDITQNITIKFHKNSLEDFGLYPEIGDIIVWNEQSYEITAAIEDQFVGGQTDRKHSILCSCVRVKESIARVEEIQEAVADSYDSLYE